MTNKKRRSRWKRLPIPTEVVNQLTDKNIPEISRIELAEKIRKEYSYPQTDMLPYFNCSDGHYCRHIKILRSGNMMLRQLVQDGVGVSTVCKLLADPGSTENYHHYPNLVRVKNIANEIIYESKHYILYRYKGELFLGIALLRSHEIICRLDDNPSIVKTIMELLNNGYTIYANMAVLDNQGNNSGFLQHHLIATLSDTPLSAVRDSMVRFRQKNCGDTFDLRLSNMQCKKIIGGNMIYKCRNQIKILNHNSGIVTSTDYTDWMYDLLLSKKESLCFFARDGRLCLPLGEHYEYLYHILMAVELYGIPENEADLCGKIDKFRENFLDKGKTVDHLDNDSTNNVLQNLMVMTKKQNTQKQSLESQIKKLGLPYFCWAERYDDISVKLRAGYVSPLKMPTYIIDGIYTIPDYLKKMEDFICAAKEEVMIYDELYRKEESNGSQV